MAILKNSRDCQDTLENWWNEYGKDSSSCYKIICAFCGKVFYARTPKAKYCSYRCTNDAYITKRKQRKKLEREKICPVCGKPFQAKKKTASTVAINVSRKHIAKNTLLIQVVPKSAQLKAVTNNFHPDIAHDNGKAMQFINKLKEQWGV